MYSELSNVEPNSASDPEGISVYKLVTYLAGEIDDSGDFSNRCEGLFASKSIMDVPVGNSAETDPVGMGSKRKI